MRHRSTAPAVFLGGAALILAAAVMPGTVAEATRTPQWPAGQNQPSSAGGSGAEQAGSSSDRAEDGATDTVTLLTGDQVTYTRSAHGGAPSFRFEAAPRPDGADVTFATLPDPDGGHLVLPSDAAGLVASGLLDDELFDVETLVQEGLAAGNAELPVIVTYGEDAGASAVTKAARALPASTSTHTLESINGAALTVQEGQAGRFWSGLRQAAGEPTPRPAAGEPTPSQAAGRVQKVWLDRSTRASLDQSVPLVGAPTAWNQGLDGRGVTVAVLDSGIDLSHPDVADQVVATANFSDTADTSDPYGHGTHVASTIAGTGAASGGRYTGVAPGADLIVGKVLDDSGNGSMSWAIDGMEWAAEQGATVVNLSLGVCCSAGDDPQSLALNRLTKEYGTLFVAAAGNVNDDLAVSTPAVADEALAVGAVDKETGTELGPYSRGPRLADAAVKPNIVAPGVGIVAARSSNSSLEPVPGAEQYTPGSGTSMATPHVAGATAILAQQHPEWTAAELRDAVTSTVARLNDNWYEHGAGRLDLAQAVTQEVSASWVVDFRRLERGSGAATRQVTYRNSGDEPVTLVLGITTRGWSGEPAPDGAIRLGADTVTVPAQGSASVDLVVDPDVGEMGAYGGWVTADSGDGEVRLTTPFSYYSGPKTHELEISVRSSYGETSFQGGSSPNPLIYVLRLDEDRPDDPFEASRGVAFGADNDTGLARIALPAGEYEVIAQVGERLERTRSSVLIETVSLSSDQTVTLDASKTVPIRPVPPEASEGRGSIRYVRTFDDRPDYEFVLSSGLPGKASAYHGDTYISPVSAPTIGERSLSHQWAFEPAVLRGAVATGPGGEIELHPAYDRDDLAESLTHDQTFPVVFAGQGRPSDLEGVDVAGKLVLVAVPLPDSREPYIAASYAMNDAATLADELGAAGLIGYLDVPADGQRLPSCSCAETFHRLGLDVTEGRALAAALEQGPVEVSLEARTGTDPVYHLRYDFTGAVPDQPERVNRDDLVRIDTQYHADEPVGGREYVESSDGTPSTVMQLATTFNLPLALTQYFGPTSPDVTWLRWVDNGPLQVVTHDRFTKPRRQAEHWFKAPLVPGTAEVPADYPVDVRCAMCLDGDRFIPAEYWLDSDPRHFSYTLGPSGSSNPRLYVDGQELESDGRSPRSFLVPPGSRDYRLVAEEHLGWTLSEQVNTTWEFTSKSERGISRGYACEFGTPCTQQPAVLLRYDLPLDLRNRAPAGAPFSFRLDADEHSAAPANSHTREVEVQYSADDGATWQDARVRRDGRDAFDVRLTHPPLSETNGFVSLRVHAVDSAGGATSQTITRAYALK